MAAVDELARLSGYPEVPRLSGYGTPATLQALHDIARAAPAGDIVELGTYKAQGAIVMALADRYVVTIDHYRGEAELGPTATWEHLTGGYQQAAVEAVAGHLQQGNVELVIGRSDVVLGRYQSGWKRNPPANIGLLVIDAGHEEISVSTDFLSWAPFITNGWVTFDDANFPGPGRVVEAALLSKGWKLVRTDADGRLATIARRDS